MHEHACDSVCEKLAEFDEWCRENGVFTRGPFGDPEKEANSDGG